MQKTPTALDNSQRGFVTDLIWGYLGLTFSLNGCGG